MLILLAISLLIHSIASVPGQHGLAPQALNSTAQAPVQSSTDQLVLLNVSVRTHGGSVTGLGKDAFTVRDNKKPREIVYFSQDDVPLSVAIIFDLSGSMLGGPTTDFGTSRVKLIREQFSQFIRASNASNEYFVIGVNDKAQLLAGGVAGDRAISIASDLLSANRPKGGTALYDACYLGIEKVMRGKHRKKAILLFSDGQDNKSKYGLNELRRSLRETSVIFLAVQIYGIGRAHEWEGQIILSELADISGGYSALLGDTKELIAYLNIIATALRHQYTLGIKPDESTADGKWHKLKVEVKLPPGVPIKQKDIWIRTREGYYAIQ